MKHLAFAASLTFAVAMIAAPPSALAQSPVGDAYGGQGAIPVVPLPGGTVSPDPPAAGVPAASSVAGAQDQGAADEGAPTEAVAGIQDASAGRGPTEGDGQSLAAGSQVLDARSLPFTGFDLLLLALGGVALLGLGFATRRLSRQRNLPA
ncbi:MAG: hypothetical protein ACR2LK_02770 [Solirubrobacteraceae bacterium]